MEALRLDSPGVVIKNRAPALTNTCRNDGVLSEQLMRHPDFFLKRYSPVTTQMAFVDMPAAAFSEVVAARAEMLTKMWELPWEVKKQYVQGSLEKKLDALLPLTSVRSSKTLVSATRANWSTYIPNGSQGGDAHSEPSYLAGKLGVRTLTVVLVEDVPNGQPGSVQFVLRDGRQAVAVEARHGIMHQYPTRSIVVHKESHWEFSEQGERLPFEEVERYQRKKIRERLTFEMVERYCGHLGIQLFDPEFYAGEGYVVHTYPPPNAAYLQKYPNQEKC